MGRPRHINTIPNHLRQFASPDGDERALLLESTKAVFPTLSRPGGDRCRSAIRLLSSGFLVVQRHVVVYLNLSSFPAGLLVTIFSGGTLAFDTKWYIDSV